MAARSAGVKRIFFYVTTFIVSLLVVEAGFRAVLAFWVGPRVLFYGSRFQRQIIPATTPDDHTVMQHGNTQQGYTKFFPNELKVDHDKATGEIFKVSINKRGFRGGEISEAKKPGVIRIVTLGASSTFGYFDRDNETYPYYLEQKLNEDSRSKGRFEVINLGIPHLQSEQILALFLAEAIPLHPDVVTFYEAVNDAARGNPSKNEREMQNPTLGQKLSSITPLKAGYGIARDHLVAVAFVDSLRQNMIAQPTFNSRQVEHHITGTSEHFIRNIDTLYRECQRRGISFVALKQQARSNIVQDIKGLSYAQEVQMVKNQLEKEGAIARSELFFLTQSVITTNLENWATSTSVPFVDVQKVLDQDRDVLLSWVHLSPRGNRMIADALAEKIKQLVGRQVVS
jgi:lysophospholipase L1-like esterase